MLLLHNPIIQQIMNKTMVSKFTIQKKWYMKVISKMYMFIHVLFYNNKCHKRILPLNIVVRD
jgi:hypothetical protein